APFDDPAAVGGDPPALTLDHDGPHVRVGGHRRDGSTDPGPADGVGDIGVVDQDPVADLDVQVAGHLGHRLAIVAVDAPLDDGPGHRTVHGTGIEPLEAEAGGQGPGQGRLARTGRTVDGHG